MSDPRWQRPCSLMGCPQRLGPHHHHMVRGHLSTVRCTCPNRDQPGTELSASRATRDGRKQPGR